MAETGRRCLLLRDKEVKSMGKVLTQRDYLNSIVALSGCNIIIGGTVCVLGLWWHNIVTLGCGAYLILHASLVRAVVSLICKQQEEVARWSQTNR